MKVGYPVQRFSYTSKDILPASCTSKPQVSCTSGVKVNEGLSNQQIYEGLVSVKDCLISLFGGKKDSTKSLNYLI